MGAAHRWHATVLSVVCADIHLCLSRIDLLRACTSSFACATLPMVVSAVPFPNVRPVAIVRASHQLLCCAAPGSKRLYAKLALNVPPSDLIHVLTNDAELPWLAHLLEA